MSNRNRGVRTVQQQRQRAEQELAKDFGVRRFGMYRRCPNCGTLNELGGRDGTCLHCVSKTISSRKELTL